MIQVYFAELVGAMLGAALTWLAYFLHREVTEDKGDILGTFATGAMIKNDMAAFFCEIVATTFLFICLLHLGVN